MTKITPPPFILELWGKLNKGRIAFRRFRRTIVLEVDPSPSYTRTTAQATVRDTFKEAVEEWNKLTPEEKEQYDREASKYGLTGYQYFISQYLKEHLAPPPPLEPAIEITITEKSGTDLTDYQVLLVINNDPDFFNAVGTDTTKLEIRAEDKTTLLDFYIEEWDTENHNAKIWIKIPSIPANGTVKAYIYSNPDRTESLSDPESVFDLFDDFNGSELDTNKWQILGTLDTVELINGELHVITASGHALLASKTSFNRNIIIEDRGRLINREYGQAYCIQDSETQYLSTYYYRNGWYQKIVYRENGTESALSSSSTSLSLDTYYIRRTKLASDKIIFELYDDNGSLILTLDATHTALQNGYVGFRTYGDSAGSSEFYCDWIRIRKYTDPEPTVEYTIL